MGVVGSATGVVGSVAGAEVTGAGGVVTGSWVGVTVVGGTVDGWVAGAVGDTGLVGLCLRRCFDPVDDPINDPTNDPSDACLAAALAVATSAAPVAEDETDGLAPIPVISLQPAVPMARETPMRTQAVLRPAHPSRIPIPMGHHPFPPGRE